MCVSPSTTQPAHRRNHRPGRATALGAIPRRPQHWCCNESKSHGKAWKGTKKMQSPSVFDMSSNIIELQEDHRFPSMRFTDSPRSSPNWIHSRHLDHGEVVGCKALVEIIFARNLQQIRKWNSNIGSCTFSKTWNELLSYIAEWSHVKQLLVFVRLLVHRLLKWALDAQKGRHTGGWP